MARHSFPYVTIPLTPSAPFPNGQTVYRPWVVTRLTAENGNTFQCVADVDSGADSCVFPASFAGALGLDLLQMKQHTTGGVGNTGNITHYAELTIEVGTWEQNGSWSFNPELKFKAYTGFTAGLEDQGIGLLGECDFFERYVVTLDHKSRLFHIE
jgi:hypothetical protein